MPGYPPAPWYRRKALTPKRLLRCSAAETSLYSISLRKGLCALSLQARQSWVSRTALPNQPLLHGVEEPTAVRSIEPEGSKVM